MTLAWDRVKFLAWWAAVWAFLIRYRAAAIAIALLALLLVVAAFNHGWIKPPMWYTSMVTKPQPALQAADASRFAAEAERAARAASASRLATETAANSAKFAEEGSARNASSSASSARSSATSAAAAKISEGKSEAAASRAEKAATRAEAVAKATPKPAVVPKVPATPPEKRAEQKPDTRVAGAGPESYSSLQPFQRFARGAGEGMAYEYRPRTKAEFVALLRDKELAKREMRVPCEVLVRQMAEGHKALPLEGCEGTAALIERDSRFTVVACNDEMFLRSNFLTVTNESGSGFGVWHRKCLPNEQVLSYEGSPLISLLCLNVAVPAAVPEPVRPAPPPVAAVPAPSPPVIATSDVCPKGWSVTANAWSLAAMPEDLRRDAEKLISEASIRDSDNGRRLEAYKPSAFSRTLHKRLREQGRLQAPVNADIAMEFLNPRTGAVESNLGFLRLVNGVGTFRFPDDPRNHVVRMTWPADFISPASSGDVGRILMIFGNEWKWCAPHAHGAVR